MTLFEGVHQNPDVDSDAERRALVALMLVPNVGWSRTRTLIQHLKRPTAVFNAAPSVLQQVPDIGPQTARAIQSFDDHDAVATQFERARAMDITLITLWDDAYPERLRMTYDPPPCLWVRGALRPTDTHALAVVGTRRCTDYGRAVTRDLAHALVQQGSTIVSGLAYGIDAVAHRTALKSGGRTLAVLGSGLGRIYPQKHTHLAHDIAEQGAVLSEYALDEDPNASNFPERNRVVSGLTLGTLIVESHAKGGALITARLAVEQNREVFAVPGPVGRSASEGTNRLIQRGHAKLVLTVDDLLEELPAPPASDDPPAASPAAVELDGAEATLYAALSDEPVHIDVLCATVGMSSSEALAHLFQLELKGVVEQRIGKQFCRA